MNVKNKDRNKYINNKSCYNNNIRVDSSNVFYILNKIFKEIIKISNFNISEEFVYEAFLKSLNSSEGKRKLKDNDFIIISNNNYNDVLNCFFSNLSKIKKNEIKIETLDYILKRTLKYNFADKILNKNKEYRYPTILDQDNYIFRMLFPNFLTSDSNHTECLIITIKPEFNTCCSIFYSEDKTETYTDINLLPKNYNLICPFLFNLMGESEDLLDLNKKQKNYLFFDNSCFESIFENNFDSSLTEYFDIEDTKKKLSLSLGFESGNIYKPTEKDLNMKWNIYTIPNKINNYYHMIMYKDSFNDFELVDNMLNRF